ncbi:MAG TPA: aldehyde dehydrogenase family protein [Gemmatimonadales bacterium]|nr:aldehyde dehydrogenase family protein [Gemmatimonadales bacterium]
MVTIAAPVRPSAPTAPRPPAPPASSAGRLDDAVDRVGQGAAKLVRLSLDERVSLARSMQAGYLAIARESVHAACTAKGIPLGTPLEGEEWTVGPWSVVRHLRLVQQSLLAVKHTGNTAIGPIGRTSEGRLTAQVFPAGAIDGALFKGVRVDVHLAAGVGERELHDSRASFYRGRRHDGRVVLVLGAGNLNGISSHDVITKIFNEGKACVLKMNPVNAYLGPYLERAYADAVREGYLAVVYGGTEEGGYLASHGGVDEIHLTGSDKTYDQLVWGPPGPERETRKRENRPLLTKPVTAELGGVSPVIVVPGPYGDKDLAYQAEDVASGLTFNAAFDCNANRVVVLPRGWPERDAFIARLRAALERAADRPAYYPGARERWERFARGRGVKLGGRADGSLPWTLIEGVDADAADEPLFREESFAPIIVETSVGGTDPLQFLDAATRFANDRLWGTLSAGLVVHPRSMKDSALGAAVEQAIGRLRYGVVTVNAWSGLPFVFGTPPWGAHPSSDPRDIQSGTGWVHNTPMLEQIEKAVMRHPLVAMPKPAYSIGHRSAHRLMPRMTALDEHQSWSRMPGVLAAAMRA